MKRKFWKLLLLPCLAFTLLSPLPLRAEDLDDDYGDDVEIADPLEPVNRVFYVFNDKLYFWVFKPIATGYEKVVPKKIALGIDNMFDNVAVPKRLVGCLLQGRFKDSGTELARFGLNSTAGVLGFFDVAERAYELEPHNEDLGQTFGKWGIGPGIAHTWPLFGPANTRDSVGMVGDFFLDPINYIPNLWIRLGLKAEDKTNDGSLHLGEYEKSKEAALDHYLSIRDIREQYREEQIKK